jgi:hypothetical protein
VRFLNEVTLMKSRTLRSLPITILSLLLSGPAFGQVTTATLYGIVRDPGGLLLPGATVTLTQEETGTARTTVTNSVGEFAVTALPVGPYTVKIELQGFKTHVSQSLPLTSGQIARQSYEMQLGKLAESVTVESVAPLVKTASSEQMETLGSVQVGELPLSRRNITGLLRLAPGVDTTAGNRGIRFNGVGKHGAGITVDGTDANSNPEGRGLSQYGGENYIDVMSIEAVQEVQLVKGVLPAEYGGVVGGQVNLISKSGANKFRGSLFENYQGEELNARDIFLPPTTAKPRIKFNQFGGSLGGPIVQRKAFFFGTYEGYRESAFTRVQGTVPTAELRSQILAALPFPETRIVLDTLPLPTEFRNDDVGFFVGARDRRREENHVMGKTDLALPRGGLLSVTYTRMRPFALIPTINVDGANDREFRHKQDRIAANFMVTRAQWVSESRVGWNKSDMEREDRFFQVKDPRRAEANIWGRRMGQLSISGLFSTPGSEVWDMHGTAYTYDQKLSRTAGQHLFKGGFRWARQTGSRSNPENPVFQFQNKADLLANIPSQVRPTFGAPPHTSYMDEIGGFLQDDWRVTRSLVLNLGLRYDYYAPVRLTPTTDVPVQIVNLAAPSDLRKMDFGAVLNPLEPYKADGWVNLGPRAGFAWAVGENHDNVVRGGIGVLFSPQMPAVVRQGAAHPLVPFRVSWNRTDALARGLTWPSYNDDLRLIVEREAAATGKPFFFSLIDPKLQNPYSVQTMLSFQRALGRTLMAEAGYVRVDGRRFIQQRLFGLAIDRETGERPNPSLGAPGGYYVDNSQTSEYNALQASIRKRFANRYSFDVHYTLSKGTATQGGDVGAYYQGDFEDFTQDFFNPEADRGPTVSDAQHRVNADIIYELPRFEGRHPLLRHTLGGWELSGIFSSRSGERLLITQPSGIPNSRPDFVGGNPVLPDWRSTRLYLNRDSFALVPTSPLTRATLRPGTVKPDQVRGPANWVLDGTLAKSFALRQQMKLQVRADMFNLLNRVNYSGPETNILSAFFGQIRSAGSPRTIQIGARISF